MGKFESQLMHLGQALRRWHIQPSIHGTSPPSPSHLSNMSLLDFCASSFPEPMWTLLCPTLQTRGSQRRKRRSFPLSNWSTIFEWQGRSTRECHVSSSCSIFCVCSRCLPATTTLQRELLYLISILGGDQDETKRYLNLLQMIWIWSNRWFYLILCWLKDM